VAAGKRRLAAIVAADVAGYSRLVGQDEDGTLSALRAHRDELIDPQIARHGGRVANTAGDSLLIEFASAVDAVRCAIAIQHGMVGRNIALPRDRQIQFRIGINVGDVIEHDGDLLGDGVNVAARLENLAEPGEIYLSRAARDQVRDRLSIDLEDLGTVQVKNIARAVRVFRLREGAHAASPAPGKVRRRRPVMAVTLAALLALLAAVVAFLVLRPQALQQLAAILAPAEPTDSRTTATIDLPATEPMESKPPVARPREPQAVPKTTSVAEPTGPARPQQIEAATPVRAEPEAEPVQQPPSPSPVASYERFQGSWAGEAFCDYEASSSPIFGTRKFAFRIKVDGYRAELELIRTALRDSSSSAFRWSAPMNPQGQADADTAVVTGRKVPVTIDLSAAPESGQVDFDGCVVDLVLSPSPAAVIGAVNGEASPPAAEGGLDGQWSAFFDDCGTSFFGRPLVYDVVLQVRQGTFRADLEVADSHHTERTTLSGPVETDGRLEGRFETSLKTSEVQILRADVLADSSTPWITIDNCRRNLVPAS